MDNSSIDFRNLFESSPGLYLVLDTDLKIIAVSNEYLKATMTARENILGHDIFEVFPDNPQDRTATGVSNLRSSLTRVLTNKIPDTMAVQKYDIPKPLGGFEERYWSPHNSPVFDKEQRLIYIIHRVTDVTEFIYLKQKDLTQLKETEELKSKTEWMEAEIFLRAQELQEANKKLREANQALEQFSYLAAHDLNEPLNTIANYVQLIEKRYKNKLDQDANDFIHFAVDGCLRMKELITSLLNYARIGKDISFVQVNCQEIVENALNSVHKVIEDNNIKVIVGNLPTVRGDKPLLEALFRNLISNACKFRCATNPTIKIGAEELEKSFCFTIEDNGIGFNPKENEKIFDLFRRLHSRSTYPGSGIGLSICKKIVEIHGGKIWAESQIDKGSTFTFTLSKS